MDPVLKLKLIQEKKLARRFRGTVSKFIDAWFKTKPYERQALINSALYSSSIVLHENQKRTSLLVKRQTLTPGHRLHITDSNHLIGGVVKALVEFEDNDLTKGEFKQRLRNWATNTAIRLTQRDVEQGRWAKIQQSTNGLVYKAWQSRMDGIERPDHHNASLRYQARPIPISEPFVLGPLKNRLMFPGDATLGASPKQTFNCRCSVTYFNSDGKKLDGLHSIR